MAVNINWGLAQTPDIAGGVFSGYQAGHQQRQETDTRNALQSYANGGGVGPLIAADPRTGLAFQQADRQAAREQRTEDQATQQRHLAGTVQVLTGALSVPLAGRAAALAEAIRNRPDVWGPDDAQRAIDALASPQADLSDTNLIAQITAHGGDPDAGAYTLAPNSVRVARGRVAAVGQPEPIIRGNMWTQPTLPRVGDPVGGATEGPGGAGATPGLSAAPTGAQPQPPAPAPSGGATLQPASWVVSAIAPLNPTPAETAAVGAISHTEGGGSQHPARNTRSPSHQGAFQFDQATFNSVLPHGDINSPQDQAQAALLLVRRNTPVLADMLGRAPTPQELELFHMQGPAGGPALFRTPPDVNAIEALVPAYRGNRARATQAILNNGGTADMTVGQFRDHWLQGHGGASPPAADQTATAADDAGLPPGYHRLPATPSDRVTYRPATIDDVRPLGYTRVPQGAQTGSDGQVHIPTASANNMPTLTQDSIENYARQFILDPASVRNIAGRGQAGQANITAIANRATEIQQETGMSGADAVVAHYGVRAAGATLRQQTQLRSNVAGFEQTFEQNANLAIRLSTTGAAGTGIPVFNSWVQHGRRAWSGDPQVVAYDAAIRTVASEYAKISEGNTGSGGSSVESRRAAEELLNAAQTPQQLAAVIQTMRADNAHRLSGLNSQIDGLTSSIRHAGGGAFAEGAASAGSRPARASTSPRIAASVGTSGNQGGATPPGTVAAGVPDRQGNFPRPPAAPAPAAPSRPAPPRQGAIVRGYRYTGGDPANPRSWQRAQ